MKKLSESDQTKTIINEHHHIIDFKSMRAVTTMIGMGLVILSSIYLNFWQFEQNDKLKDNDLKFRYIKMYDGISADHLYKLETAFHYDRNVEIIKGVRKNVTNYERALENAVGSWKKQALRKRKRSN